jgi:hypothetical protein
VSLDSAISPEIDAQAQETETHRGLTSFRREALEKLGGTYFASANTNLDGERVPAIVYLFAMDLLAALPISVPDPDIYADPDGEIGFEWASGKRAVFVISVGRDGTLSYAGLFGHDTNRGTELLRSSLPETIVALIKRALEPSQ